MYWRNQRGCRAAKSSEPTLGEGSAVKYQLYIDGKWVDPDDGEWLDTIDPYRGEPWVSPRGKAADAARAVDAARQAMTQGPWATMSASGRGALMRNIGDLIAKNAKRLARSRSATTVSCSPKCRASSRPYQKSGTLCGFRRQDPGRFDSPEKPNTVAFTTREPIGVVAALTAWNSPLWFATVKSAPAMAAGCAVVVKPSEFASASTLELARLMSDAGLPDGVFNVVTGLGPEVGSALVEHPDVAKIAFTGSDVTGAKIYETAARSMKRVALELGGKSPNIVFDDADLDLAAAGVISGIFGAAGQMCSAGSRC